MSESFRAARFLSENHGMRLIISIVYVYIVFFNCHAQDIPLHGQLEVTDSIIGLSEFNSSVLNNKIYDERGITIWQLQPKDLPYIDGLKFYAKKEGGNISVMVQSENSSLALRGLLPVLAGSIRDTSYLCTYPDESCSRYTNKNTLIYYLLENSFEDLKNEFAIPLQASLSGNPSYKSAFSDGVSIFGHYISYSEDEDIYHIPRHNWPMNDVFVEATFNLILKDPIRYISYGRIYHSKSDNSSIFYNGTSWLSGSESRGIRYGGSEPLLNFKMHGEKGSTADNTSAVLAMVWAAIDAKDVQANGTIESLDKNLSISSSTDDPDVLKRIDMNYSKITWPSLAIYDFIPEDGSRLSSDNVLFTWRTTRNSSTELFYRQEGEGNYSSVVGEEGIIHAIPLNLKRNASYEFYAFSNASGDSNRSEFRHISIDNGIAFARKKYEFEINRDYSQHLAISVKNTDVIPHEILVSAINPYNDVYLGFVGNGSLNKTLKVEPGETKDLEFIFHAQDAKSKHYDILVRANSTDENNITDNALIGINIRWPEFNIKINQIDEDKETLIKKFRVHNLGDTITDFSIIFDDPLKDEAYLYPNVIHYNFVKGSSIEFYAIPLFKEDGSIIEGNMTAQGANESKNYTLRFECLEGSRPYRARVEMPTYVIDLSGWYCTNNPDIKIPFRIPPGFNSSDVISAKAEIDFDLPWERSAYLPHDVYVSINGRDVGTIINDIPNGRYVFEFPSDILGYANFNSADNVIRINTKHLPQAHYVVNTHIRIKLCLKKTERWICAPDANKAVDRLWKTPGVEKNYPSLNVSFFNPSEGQKLILGKPVLISVAVMGNKTGNMSSAAQRYADVRATFGNEYRELVLFDDGMHNDGQVDDGLYACVWTPQVPGNTTIAVKASNCRSDGEGVNSIMVWVVIPDLNVTFLDYSPKEPLEGMPVEINFTVENLGSSLAEPCMDSLFIDGKQVFTSDRYILESGKNRLWNYTYKGDAGYHTLTACTDIAGIVRELDENNNCRNLTIYLSRSVDLNVTNLNVINIGSNGTLREGSPITISINETNWGNGTAGDHTDNLTIDGKLINSTNVRLIPPKESYIWSYNLTSLPHGNHTISAYVDSINNVNETDESNNGRDLLVYIPLMPPNLNITDINFFGDRLEGSPILISVNITNLGNDTAGNHTDRLIIDGVPTNLSEVGSLSPRESYKWNNSYILASGNHTIGVCTDITGLVKEFDESDNCSAKTIYIQPRSDLSITDIEVNGDSLEGSPQNIYINVTNIGKGFAGNHTDSLSIDGVLINLTDVGSLMPGESRKWNYNYTFTTAGNYAINACTDAMGDIKEFNESNNCRDRTIYIWPRSDLNITSIKVNGELAERSNVTISVSVTNIGKGLAGNHTDSLSIDGMLFPMVNVGSLMPGDSGNWSYNYTFAAGNHTISTCTDVMGAVKESNESNNCRNRTIYIPPLPDLNIKDIKVLGDYIDGLPAAISVNVTNMGNDTAGNHTDKLIIDGILTNLTNAKPLMPKENGTWSYNYSFTAGNHSITACTDSTEVVNESNESNNCNSIAIQIGFRSDLNITGIGIRGDLDEGWPQIISIDTMNLREGIAGSHNDSLSIDGVLVNLTKLGPIMPGENKTWDFSYIFTDGNHTISACTDYDEVVKEYNESNNCRNRTIYISPLPDLNIRDINISGDYHEGLPITISVNATNLGNETAGVHNDSLSIDGTQIYLTEVKQLIPGEDRIWTYTNTFTAGNHTVSVCTDANGTIKESNESNNCSSRLISILPLPDLKIMDISANGALTEGDPINLTINVTNLGKGTAGNHKDKLDIDGIHTYLIDMGPIEPGKNYTLNHIYHMTWNHQHKISVLVDVQKEISESNEKNNDLCKDFYAGNTSGLMSKSDSDDGPHLEGH